MREGRSVSASSACIGASAPQSTALRWIKTFETMGLVRKTADPDDARRYHVRLSRRAVRQMEELIAEAAALIEKGP